MIFIIIGLVLLLALYIFIKIKINNFIHRGEQHLLGKVGLSGSNISAGINNLEEGAALPNFLLAHPNYTEESVKNILTQFSYDIVNKQNNGCMSELVLTKIINDNSLDMIKTMAFSRISITGYRKEQDSLLAVAIFSNGKDEQNLILYVDYQNNNLFISKYDSLKGAVLGF